MKIDDILLGACLYALIILIGFSGPSLRKMEWGYWIDKIDALAHDYFFPTEKTQALGGPPPPSKEMPAIEPGTAFMRKPSRVDRNVKEGLMASRTKPNKTDSVLPNKSPMNMEVNPL